MYPSPTGPTPQQSDTPSAGGALNSDVLFVATTFTASRFHGAPKHENDHAFLHESEHHLFLSVYRGDVATCNALPDNFAKL